MRRGLGLRDDDAVGKGWSARPQVSLQNSHIAKGADLHFHHILHAVPLPMNQRMEVVCLVVQWMSDRYRHVVPNYLKWMDESQSFHAKKIDTDVESPLIGP